MASGTASSSSAGSERVAKRRRGSAPLTTNITYAGIEEDVAKILQAARNDPTEVLWQRERKFLQRFLEWQLGAPPAILASLNVPAALRLNDPSTHILNAPLFFNYIAWLASHGMAASSLERLAKMHETTTRTRLNKSDWTIHTADLVTGSPVTHPPPFAAIVKKAIDQFNLPRESVATLEGGRFAVDAFHQMEEDRLAELEAEYDNLAAVAAEAAKEAKAASLE